MGERRGEDGSGRTCLVTAGSGIGLATTRPGARRSDRPADLGAAGPELQVLVDNAGT